MNVTFQSSIAGFNKPHRKKKTEEKAKESKKLVVDRIVGGKVMKAADFEKLRRNPTSKPLFAEETHDDHLHHRGALT